MITLLLHATLLSLDSLVVSLAISSLLQTASQRWRWAALFGVCDCLAVLLGYAAGGRLSGFEFPERFVPLFVLCCGVYCLVAAFQNEFRVNPRLAAMLPVLMSFDNFAYGFATSPVAGGVLTRAVVFGLCSFGLATLGVALGQYMRLANRRGTKETTGFALIAASLILFLA